MADKIVTTYDFDTKQAVTSVDNLNKKLNENDVLLNKVNQTASKVRTSGFNPLNNSINQFARELPNAAISAQVFFTSISNQFGQLQDAVSQLIARNRELAAQGQKTQSVFKTIAGSVFSFATLLQVGVTLLVVYGKEIGNLISSLFKGAEAFNEARERIKLFNEAIQSKSVATAIENVRALQVNIDLAKKGFIDQNAVVKQYNETLGKTTGQVSSLAEAEQSLIDNGRAYVQLTLLKAQANAALQLSVSKTIEAEQKRVNAERGFLGGLLGGLNPLTGFQDVTGLGAGQQANQILALERQATQFFNVFEKFQTDAAALAEKNDLLFFTDTQKTQVALQNIERIKTGLTGINSIAAASIPSAPSTGLPGGLQPSAAVDVASLSNDELFNAIITARKNGEREYTEFLIAELKRRQDALDADGEKQKELIKQLQDFAIQSAGQITQELFSLRSNQATAEADEQLKILEENKEKELEAVGNNRKKQAQIEAEYDRKRAEILNRNAQTQRTLQLSEISVNTALAVAKAIAESPTTFGLPFSAFALAQGAIQYAFASSQPLPKYAKGTANVLGGIEGQDSVLSLLTPHEAVIPVKENKKYPGMSKAWVDGRLDQFLAMNYLAPALDELSRKAQVSVSNNYSNSTNNSFSDRKIVKSMQENTMVNRLILRQMKISNNDWKIPRKNNNLWN